MSDVYPVQARTLADTLSGEAVPLSLQVLYCILAVLPGDALADEDLPTAKGVWPHGRDVSEYLKIWALQMPTRGVDETKVRALLAGLFSVDALHFGDASAAGSVPSSAQRDQRVARILDLVRVALHGTTFLECVRRISTRVEKVE